MHSPTRLGSLNPRPTCNMGDKELGSTFDIEKLLEIEVFSGKLNPISENL
jgi:hypothetical protein